MPFYLPLIIAGLVLETIFIRQEYAKKLLPALVIKSLASLVFVSLGAINYSLAANQLYALLILLGLVFGMIGDIMLNLRYLYTDSRSNRVFAVGIAAFLLGHLLYMVALVLRLPAALYRSIPAAVILSILLIPLLLKNINPPGKGLKVFGIVYLAIVTAMFAFAAGLLSIHKNMLNTVFTIAAFLFMASDYILIYYFFGKKKIRPLRAVNLMCYYISQLLIAMTILMR
ncbi:hypothetical protein MASR2M29_18920 [Spirochaetota bacterium]